MPFLQKLVFYLCFFKAIAYIFLAHTYKENFNKAVEYLNKAEKIFKEELQNQDTNIFESLISIKLNLYENNEKLAQIINEIENETQKYDDNDINIIKIKIRLNKALNNQEKTKELYEQAINKNINNLDNLLSLVTLSKEFKDNEIYDQINNIITSSNKWNIEIIEK